MIFFLLIFRVFGYFNYNKHGEDWPGICNISYFQSPIDITTNLSLTIPSTDTRYWYLDLYYYPAHVINLNQTTSTPILSGFNYNQGINFNIISNFGRIYLNTSSSSIQYNSRSVSIHYPAEHTFNENIPGINSEYVLEVQIDHVNSANSSDVLIISFLFVIGGSRSYFLDQVIDSFNKDIGGDIDCTFASNGWYVIKNFYSYNGSETQPTCKEGVTWVISMDILNTTQDQLLFFSSKLTTTNTTGNFRYTMPQNGRNVIQYTANVFSKAIIFAIYLSLYLF